CGRGLKSEATVLSMRADQVNVEGRAASKQQHVIPLQLNLFAIHKASGSQNDDDRKKLKRLGCEVARRAAVPFDESANSKVIETVGSPSGLPRTEVSLPTLLVEVGEDEQQNQGGNSGNHDNADEDGVHGLSRSKCCGRGRTLSAGRLDTLQGRPLFTAMVPQIYGS